MAVIAPTTQINTDGIPHVHWTSIASGDTATAFAIRARAGEYAAISIGGTFGAATVTVEVSQNNVNFYPLKDRDGTTISTTAAALFEFSTAAMYIRPVVTGAGATISCIMTLRGPASSV
jgi:hypothetical protein